MTAVLRNSALIAGSFALAAAGVFGARHLLQERAPPTVQLPPPPLVVAAPAPVVPAPAPAAAPLAVAVLLGDRAYDITDAPIALGTDSRFRLRIGSAVAGRFDVHAINPDGVATATPLWGGRIAAGGRATSPALRLEGTRGIETLRIVLRPADGAPPVVQTVRLGHY